MTEVTELPESRSAASRGDRRDGIYVWSDEIDLAVEVALATGRPLLVRGATGAGKSSLAFAEATKRGWRYYEQTITSRTQARELLWEVDQLARFQDARAGQAGAMRKYVRPGILWWAINRDSAKGFAPDARDPNLNTDSSGRPVDSERAVVLIDEIDKADPDVPNNLLVPLGSYRFQIEELVEPVTLDRTAQAPLIIITSNGERELPPAFLRRCVEHYIEDANDERLLDIAEKHFPNERRETLKGMLTTVVEAQPERWSGPPLPSPAELIDCISAILRLPPDRRAAIPGLVVWKRSVSELR